MIEVNINDQVLTLWQERKIVHQCAVSTAKKIGNHRESFATPLGYHKIRLRIGEGAQDGTIFKGRRPTGEVLDLANFDQSLKEDFIITRILWLQGINWGFNRGAKVDTLRRYIYIHGTPYTDNLGLRESHGCIRLSPNDMKIVFDFAKVGEQVYIGLNGLPL